MDGVNILSDFDDFARDITAGNVRKRNGNTGETMAHPQIEMIEGARVDADQNFVVAEMWFWNIGETKHIGAAVLMKDDSFH
jgi:hypothetical protein